jgi:peptidoglycan/LPS O-acetylase OafA/YrhL
MPRHENLTTSRPLHYPFLDGVRGFAALYVVLGHILQWSYYAYRGEPLPAWFKAVQLVKFGNLAVAVFIVVSGFCLMMPIARSGGDRLPKGVPDYFRRRARRILPPYYAACALALLLLALSPALRTAAITRETALWDRSSLPGALVSHLLMLHNLSRAWIYRFDGPLWSVATEWQIYFLFPFVLLPIRRRMGMAAPVVAGLLFGLVTIPLGLGQACYWYTGLFAMGMAAAMIGLSASAPASLIRLRWGLLTMALVPAFTLARYKLPDAFNPAVDMLVGLATMCLLIHCSLCAKSAAQPPGMRILCSRFAGWLGAVSYSLYLIHYPIVALEHMALAHLRQSPPVHFLALLGLSVPVLGISVTAFYYAFERPFLNTSGARKAA